MERAKRFGVHVTTASRRERDGGVSSVPGVVTVDGRDTATVDPVTVMRPETALYRARTLDFAAAQAAAERFVADASAGEVRRCGCEFVDIVEQLAIDRAKELFDQYIAKHPKDDKGLSEVGAYYLLKGDRAKAEELFDKSFRLEEEVWSTVNAAGAYLGLPPQP